MPVRRAAAEGFERGAADYERARPGYPEGAVAELVDRLGLGPGRRLLELAAGTGKLTRQLAPSGAAIVAIEPVAAMRARLVEVLGDQVGVVCGVAEALPLRRGSLDAVTVAQAFHWFDQPAALDELARVLRPGGVLALVWNVRDESVDWVRRFTQILIAGGGGTPYRRDYTLSRWRELFGDREDFTSLDARRFRAVQEVDEDLVVARAASTSFVAALAEDERGAVLERVRQLVRSHPDLVGRARFEFPHQTDVIWCRRR